MAHAEVPPFRNPLERIGETVREIPVWMGRHWKSVLLITAAGGAAISLNFLHDRGSQNPTVTVNNPISDTFKSPDPGTDSEAVAPVIPIPTETPPTATASASPEPPPTQEPTKVPPTPTAEPTAEVKEAIDCRILSLKACEKADYITWGVPDGKPQKGIGVNLDAGEKLKLPETMIVAASESATRPGNRRIAAVRKDGSQINIHGDITPVGDIGRVGKELPAGTIFAQVEGSGAKFIGEYTLVILFTNEEDLKKYFPKQTENLPRVVEINAAPQPQAANQQGRGLVFFDVKPPQSN